MVSVYHARRQASYPVGSGRKTDTPRSNGDREGFANNDPSARSPSRCEEKDVETDESNLPLDDLAVIWPDSSHDGHDEFTNEHTECSIDEEGSATKSFDGPKRDWCGTDIDEGGDKRDEERVANRAEGRLD